MLFGLSNPFTSTVDFVAGDSSLVQVFVILREMHKSDKLGGRAGTKGLFIDDL